MNVSHCLLLRLIEEKRMLPSIHRNAIVDCTRKLLVPIVVINAIALAAFLSSNLSHGFAGRGRLISNVNYATLSTPTQLIELPNGTSKVIINIGSNVDPIIPKAGEIHTHSLAFEPVVSHLIPSHIQLSVISAAVGRESGLSTIHVYNENGVSSSLAKAASSQFWKNNPARDRRTMTVPVISFKDILDAIPPSVEIHFIKTDMQGMDFEAITSVGKMLRERGVQRLMTKVYLDNVRTYQDVHNDFCRDWLDYMTSLGYTLFHLGQDPPAEAIRRCEKANKEKVGLKETDAYWRLDTIDEEDSLDKYQYPSVPTVTDQRAENQFGNFEHEGWKPIQVYVGGSSYGDIKEWYSQVGQDRTVCQIFEISHGHCRDRFFLDLAANDAAKLSNTKALEDRFGWKGICIEPNSEYIFGLAHRRCDVFSTIVSSKTGDIVEFAEHPDNKDGAFGGIVSNNTDNKPTVSGTRITRHATSLLDVLHIARAPKVIDYFSFDVEGAEDLILQEATLQEFTFLVLTVERPSVKLVSLLTKYKYVYLKDHGRFGDKMFVHSSLKNLHEVQSQISS